MKPYGYFSSPDQSEPEYDPGTHVDCPICHHPLSRAIVTISLMAKGDSRSYFYRVHKVCYARLDEQQKTDLDSLIVDAIVAARNAN